MARDTSPKSGSGGTPSPVGDGRSGAPPAAAGAGSTDTSGPSRDPAGAGDAPGAGAGPEAGPGAGVAPGAGDGPGAGVEAGAAAAEASTEAPASGFVAGWKQTETLTALRELADVAGRVRPTVAERAGLSHSEMVALEHLAARPMGPAEVARLLGVTSAATTGIADRLVRRGHLERHPVEGDRRRTELMLTPSGREEILGHLLPMFRALAEMDAELDDDEREVVLRYLHRATEAFRSVL